MKKIRAVETLLNLSPLSNEEAKPTASEARQRSLIADSLEDIVINKKTYSSLLHSPWTEPVDSLKSINALQRDLTRTSKSYVFFYLRRFKQSQ